MTVSPKVVATIRAALMAEPYIDLAPAASCADDEGYDLLAEKVAVALVGVLSPPDTPTEYVKVEDLAAEIVAARAAYWDQEPVALSHTEQAAFVAEQVGPVFRRVRDEEAK